MNYGPAGDRDWLHTNSIAYNAEWDQIMVSSRDFNELWIIDSVPNELTGTEAGHLLYRWGNPEAYGRGTAPTASCTTSMTRAGSKTEVMVFSNGNERPDGFFSTVEV